MKYSRLFFLSLLFLASCGSKKIKTETQSQTAPDSTNLQGRAYKITELVMTFQTWVPEEYLAGNFAANTWNIDWEKYKVTDPAKIEPGQYNIATKDSSMTPGIYMTTLLGTIDEAAFFKPEWDSRAGSWSEAMVTSYSDKKCAGLMIELMEKYINQDKLNPSFTTEKENWLNGLKKIAE
jgi:hypothetical protein